MDVASLNNSLRGMDIYLLDQVLKGRFESGSKILDAGFGGGRNSFWFLENGYDVHGIDAKEAAVALVKQEVQRMGKDASQFTLGSLEKIPFASDSFPNIICNAVLHFAQNTDHFYAMFAELVRVLSPGGTLFIRMTSDIGLEAQLGASEDGVYLLPDGSRRFLMTRKMIETLVVWHDLKFLQALKTVNVNDVRCMSTLLLSK